MQDTTGIFAVNLRGDSVSYINWANESEILGLANTAFGDLDSMIARRYIRVLVPYSKTYYYIEGMKTYGLAYDLLNLFEKELNRQLKFDPAKVRVIFIPVGLTPVQIEFTGPYLEAEDILEMVNEGLIPFTIISEDLGKLWNSVYTDLKVYSKIAVDSNVSYGWAFRKNSPKLKAAVNKFVPQIRKGSMVGNMLCDKYLKNTMRLRNSQSKEAVADLNQFRSMFIKYGDKYSLDWLLLSAQAFQESQLKQETVSHAGAAGVMQVLPGTAASPPISIPNVRNSENNIHAGVKYMRYLIDNYFENEQIDSLNMHLMALGAYNCGPGNMRKLRREAKAHGLNENVWFNNVEIMAARHIGRETVQYVSNIYRYYWSYQALQHFKDSRDQKNSP